MAYAILRTAKLKTAGEIGGSLAHTYRTRDTPNADPERTPQNLHVGPDSPEGVKAAIEERTPAKYRKDAVRVIEYLITASPEAFKGKDGQGAYLGDALKWLQDKHGKENVVAATVHMDETTPHLVAYVVPLDPDTGRLNAKRYLGGKAKLSAMQTEFAQEVGRKHGLERGIEGSKAQHTSIREYYAEVAASRRQEPQATISAPELTPRKLKPENISERLLGVKETPEGVAKRLTAKVAPLKAEVTTLRREKRQWQQERAQLIATTQRQRKELEALALFRELAKKAPAMFEKVKEATMAAMRKFTQERERKQQEARDLQHRQANNRTREDGQAPRPPRGPSLGR